MPYNCGSTCLSTAKCENQPIKTLVLMKRRARYFKEGQIFYPERFEVLVEGLVLGAQQRIVHAIAPQKHTARLWRRPPFDSGGRRCKRVTDDIHQSSKNGEGIMLQIAACQQLTSE
jgi:hypothetical protein